MFSRKDLKFLIMFASSIMLMIANCSSLQNQSNSKAQYSAFTKRFLKEVERAKERANKERSKLVLSEKVKRRYLVKDSPIGYIVHGKIQVESKINKVDLKKLNIKVNSRIGNIWTVVIQVGSLKALGKTKGVKYIEINTPVKLK